jgi:hypothetical protein
MGNGGGGIRENHTNTPNDADVLCFLPQRSVPRYATNIIGEIIGRLRNPLSKISTAVPASRPEEGNMCDDDE